MVILDIFTDIETAVAAITEVKHFDLWNNQLDNELEEWATNFPAVFLEFSSLSWDESKQTPSPVNGDYATFTQNGALEVTLHCAFSTLLNSEKGFKEVVIPVLEKILYSINGLEGTNYGRLQRSSERQDTDHANVIDWQMTFGVSATECGELRTDIEDATNGGTITILPVINTDLDIDNDIIRTGDGT